MPGLLRGRPAPLARLAAGSRLGSQDVGAVQVVPATPPAHLDGVDRELLLHAVHAGEFDLRLGLTRDRAERVAVHVTHEGQPSLPADRAGDVGHLAVVLGRPRQVRAGVADLEEPRAPGVDVGQDGSPLQRVVHDGSTSGHGANVRTDADGGDPPRPPAGLRFGSPQAAAHCPMYRLDTSTRGMEREAGMLEFAILGLLQQSPMHGYELRKELAQVLGGLRSISFGSLYPALKRLHAAGWITTCEPGPGTPLPADAPPLTGRRGKVVYTITAEGKERFHELASQSGPEAYDDSGLFGVRLAFFRHTAADARLRILEGRRRTVEQQREGLRSSLARTRERLDRYTLELQQHGLESVDREVRWLSELIDSERRNSAGGDRPPPDPSAQPPADPPGPTPRTT